MIAMTLGAALLAMWVIYAIVAIAGIVAVFVWAVRSRQFSDQERARYLPLYAGKPLEGPESGETKPGSRPTAGGGETHVSN